MGGGWNTADLSGSESHCLPQSFKPPLKVQVAAAPTFNNVYAKHCMSLNFRGSSLYYFYGTSSIIIYHSSASINPIRIFREKRRRASFSYYTQPLNALLLRLAMLMCTMVTQTHWPIRVQGLCLWHHFLQAIRSTLQAECGCNSLLGIYLGADV